MKRLIFGLFAASVLAAVPAFAGSSPGASSTSTAGSASRAVTIGSGWHASYSAAGNASGGYVGVRQSGVTASTYSIGGTVTASAGKGWGGAGAVAAQGGGASAGTGQHHH